MLIVTLVAVGYLFLSDFWADDPPEWLQDARTLPVVETGALAVRDELSTAIESELQLLESVWNENLPALNSEIQSMGIDLISIDE